jgi:hypothetical protein
MNRLEPLLFRQLPDSQPHELQHCARILAAAVAYDPRYGIADIQFADFIRQRSD